MFLQRFSFKTGLPLFAHRFRYTFKAYIINGSSVFLKIDESPKKIVKNKNLSILKSIHNLYLNKKELVLDFFIKELDKSSKSTKKLIAFNKLMDRKIDKYTVEILNKRIYTVEKNNLNVYKTNSLLDYIEMDKNKLRKESHNISTINSIHINGTTYEIYIPNDNIRVSSKMEQIIYNTIDTLLSTKYRDIDKREDYFQINNESMKKLDYKMDLIELDKSNKNIIDIYNSINTLIKDKYNMDFNLNNIVLENNSNKYININNTVYDIYKNSPYQINRDNQGHYLNTIIIKDINKNPNNFGLVKRVIRSGNTINTVSTLKKDEDKNISSIFNGWKFIRKQPTWEISKADRSLNLNKNLIKDISLSNKELHFKKKTIPDISFKFLIYSLSDISNVNIDYNTKNLFLSVMSRKDLSLNKNNHYLYLIDRRDIFILPLYNYLKKTSNQNLFIDSNNNFLTKNRLISIESMNDNQYLFDETFNNIINNLNISKYYSSNIDKNINKINKSLGLIKYHKDMSDSINKDFNLRIRQSEVLFKSLPSYNMIIRSDDNFIFIQNDEFLNSLDNKIIGTNYVKYDLLKDNPPNIIKNYNYSSLDRLAYANIDAVKNIFIKDILNPNIDINIVKRQLKLIENKKLNKFNYDNSVNFLTLNKRWWFIKPTNPKTRINIPSIDYPYETKPIMELKEHPIQAFKDLGTNDIDVSIEILLELVNIVMHWWHHSYNELYRGLGDESIVGIMNVLHEWWNLESSQSQVNDDKTNKEYERVFRWIRWEAEKVYFDFKKDYQNNLIYNGNHYMEILTKNLLEYVEFHHYMIVPLYKSLERMDIMRAIMDDDPQGDIMVELPNKNKGERDYVIDSEDNSYLL
ncbi:hypothetical protein INTERNEXUS_235 [Bacillus phage vB_BspM_Internexus]|nr:hypothetical protein INTERNEXUS_235 [Bacillus phage vB_BspM_Internexus]